MKKKIDNTEAPRKTGVFKDGFFPTLGRWAARMFMGASRDMGNAFDVEKIVSPGRQIISEFLSRKLAVCALVIVLLVFAVVLIGPFFNPLDLSYNEVTQQNTAPGMSMLRVPAALKKDCKQISVGSTFSVGLSNDGDVYVWGNTKLSRSVNLKKIPDEIRDANIQFVAAGTDHAIAIDDTGRIYGWGACENAQYGEKGKENAANRLLYTFMPDELLEGTLDVSQIKQVECGYQVNAIVMKDGSVYMWGNHNNGATNMKRIARLENVEKIAFSGSAAIALLQDGTLNTGGFTSFDYLTVDTSGEVVEENDAAASTAIAEGLAIAPEADTDTDPAATAEAAPAAPSLRQQMPLTEYIGSRKVVDIAAADASIGLILDDGELVVVGTATSGEKDIPELAGEKAVAIAAGLKHYVLLTDQGHVYAWGANLLKQCEVPAGLTDITSLASGSFQSFAIQSDGTVHAWGQKGYLMGTDAFGRDIWNRILNGGKMTMTIGAVAVIISSVIGVVIGCLSGYFGGAVDMVLMRVTEIFSAIPFLPFALMLSAIIQQTSVSETTRIFLIMVVLGLLSWTGLARLVRGQVLAEREKEFVVAAQSMGVKESKIAFKHILPNIISVILVTMTLDFAGCMLTESSLSYLGFGVQLPRPTWGNMLYGSNNSVVIQQFWWRWVFPALFLGICTICINIVGDTLRDVMDPKSTER